MSDLTTNDRLENLIRLQRLFDQTIFHFCSDVISAVPNAFEKKQKWVEFLKVLEPIITDPEFLEKPHSLPPQP